eukprot:gnl/TRDRNA2_/TRDRNA2_193295_c0_seq1.p1 gnl/TRDRNA2_/TRDRNA2_193295_c0~~gnl/TRDRNA2_/TRDRNA2_193295_c0_seq1.p1  ORF type:complete len:165 (+),score=34.19 gnl/TRDRNA2_/TRDRNA2_193295_c0_seq1:86-580(+)
MSRPQFFKNNDMNELLTEEQKANGWKYTATQEEQFEQFGFVVAHMIRFRLHCRAGNIDVVEDYLEDEYNKSLIDINWVDHEGLTCLMWAAGCGHKEVVKALLRAGADTKIFNSSFEGQRVTALDYAKGWPYDGQGCGPHPEVVEVLQGYEMTGKIADAFVWGTC